MEKRGCESFFFDYQYQQVNQLRRNIGIRFENLFRNNRKGKTNTHGISFRTEIQQQLDNIQREMIIMQRYAPHTVKVNELNIHDYLFMMSEKKKEEAEQMKMIKKHG